MAGRLPVYLSLDVGGTQTRAAVVSSDGKILSRDAGLTPKQGGPSAAVEAIVRTARNAVAASGRTMASIEAVGLGAPGPLDPEAGIVFFVPNLPGWHEVPLRDLVQAGLGRPTFLVNDADAAAVGEHAFGAGRGVANLIYITVSTGIGGGLILGNKLYRGAGGWAGELGHMTIQENGPLCGCGNYGCWEALASGTALARKAVDRLWVGARSSILEEAGGDLRRVDAKAVHEAALKGDALAKDLIAETGRYLGIGLASLVNVFNPEMIILGGGLTQMGDMLLEPARSSLQMRAMEPGLRVLRLELAQLGDDAGLVGAMVVAREGLAQQ